MQGRALVTLSLLLERHLVPNRKLSQFHAPDGSQLLLRQVEYPPKRPPLVAENYRSRQQRRPRSVSSQEPTPLFDSVSPYGRAREFARNGIPHQLLGQQVIVSVAVRVHAVGRVVSGIVVRLAAIPTLSCLCILAAGFIIAGLRSSQHSSAWPTRIDDVLGAASFVQAACWPFKLLAAAVRWWRLLWSAGDGRGRLLARGGKMNGRGSRRDWAAETR